MDQDHEVLRPDKFARNQSYPGLRQQLDQRQHGQRRPGENKKLKDGDLDGGINLGFLWKDVVDEDGQVVGRSSPTTWPRRR